MTRPRIFELGGQRFRFSEHAARRAIDMAVDEDEIKSVLRKPRTVNAHKHRDDASYWTRGRVSLVVAYDHDDPTVIEVVTVLWSSRAGWDIDAETAPIRRRRTAGLPAREGSYA